MWAKSTLTGNSIVLFVLHSFFLLISEGPHAYNKRKKRNAKGGGTPDEHNRGNQEQDHVVVRKDA